MGRTACTEPQCLYRGALYLTSVPVQGCTLPLPLLLPCVRTPTEEGNEDSNINFRFLMNKNCVSRRAERRLRVFENRVLRRIFGPKRDEATTKWRTLHSEELNDLYFSPNIVRAIKSRRVRWAWHVAGTGERKGVYRVLVGKPEGKRPLGRPRSRMEDDIKLDLQEVGLGAWTGSSWLRIERGAGHL